MLHMKLYTYVILNQCNWEIYSFAFHSLIYYVEHVQKSLHNNPGKQTQTSRFSKRPSSFKSSDYCRFQLPFFSFLKCLAFLSIGIVPR